jgi:predicted esterase YcpF (UPF0227 family)
MLEILTIVLMIGMFISLIWNTILQRRNKKILDAFDELIVKFIEHNQLMYGKTNEHIKSLRMIAESISNQVKDFQVIKRSADDMKVINREASLQQQAAKQIVKDLRNQKLSFAEINKAIQLIKTNSEKEKVKK